MQSRVPNDSHAPPAPPQVRVYLTNVEGIARRFVDEKREYLQRLLGSSSSGGSGAGGFRKFWARLDLARQRALARDAAPAVLKVRPVGCQGLWVAGLWPAVAALDGLPPSALLCGEWHLVSSTPAGRGQALLQ